MSNEADIALLAGSGVKAGRHAVMMSGVSLVDKQSAKDVKVAGLSRYRHDLNERAEVYNNCPPHGVQDLTD